MESLWEASLAAVATKSAELDSLAEKQADAFDDSLRVTATYEMWEMTEEDTLERICCNKEQSSQHFFNTLYWEARLGEDVAWEPVFPHKR